MEHIQCKIEFLPVEFPFDSLEKTFHLMDQKMFSVYQESFRQSQNAFVPLIGATVKYRGE